MNAKRKNHRISDVSRGRAQLMQDASEVRQLRPVKISEREVLDIYIDRAKEREDIRAQHGACYRIDPITGVRTLIE